MYCLTIEENGQEPRQLFFYSRELAENKKEDLILSELNTWIHCQEKDIEFGQIQIEILEALLRSFIKANLSHCNYDVTISKISFVDE